MLRFHKKVYGKWVLSGEHSVLRGSRSLVFPLKRYEMKSTFFLKNEPFHILWKGVGEERMNEMASQFFDKVLSQMGKKRKSLKGHMVIQNELPLGEGLGSSSAICVLIAKWCEFAFWVRRKNGFELARKLENLFHGESSGMDICGSYYGRGMCYEKGKEPLRIQPLWSPILTLTSSGSFSSTKECIKKVKSLQETDRKLFYLLDENMARSVEDAKKALETPYSKQTLSLLTSSLHEARDCFERWGLVSQGLKEHMGHLISQGAIATKPTGGGLGGYVLALWSKEPPETFKKDRVCV